MKADIPRIAVYLADVTPLEDGELYDAVYRSVSAERRAKTDRLLRAADRRLSLGAEYLLMRVCKAFGEDYYAAGIKTDADGKPVFTDIPLYFNLSHSGERAMCIISNRPVGCDIEQITHADDDIARECFAAEERELLENCEGAEEKDELFFRIWTLRESYAKCVGKGFKLPQETFSVHIGHDGPSLSKSAEEGNFALYESKTEEGYCCSWCVRLADGETAASADCGLRKEIIK